MPVPSRFDPDSTDLAVVRSLLERYRREGLSDAEIRRRISEALREALPEEAVEPHDLEAIVVRWQRAVDAVVGREGA